MRRRPVWADLSLRRKGLVVVAIPLIAVSLWFVVLILAAGQGREAQRLRANTLEVNNELGLALSTLVDAQSAMRGFLVTRDPEWLTPFASAHESFPARLEHLRSEIADDAAQAGSLNRMAREWQAWESAATLAVRTPADDARAVADRLAASRPLMRQLRNTVAEMQQRENDLLAERTDAVRKTTLRFAGLALFSLVAGALGAVAASWVYSKGVVRRIEVVRRNADRLLTGEAFEPVRGRDEVGALASRFEHAAMLLRERTAELEAFTYSVSHDLRAPLRHVADFGELLRARAGDRLDAESLGYIDRMRSSAERMGQLIDALMALSRVGLAEIQRTRVSLPELLAPVIGEQRAAAPDRALDIRVGELPDVMGDPSLIRLAFTNLVANAVKYTRSREGAAIEIGARAGRAGEVEVFVKDNGVGFDMHYVDRLFGVFQRLHRPEDFEGTGIGLAIVKRVAARHGGSVRAEGEVGRGATFFLTLPGAEAGAA